MALEESVRRHPTQLHTFQIVHQQVSKSKLFTCLEVKAVRQSNLGPVKSTTPMGKVELGRLGLWAKMTMVHLAHVPFCAVTAHLTFWTFMYAELMSLFEGLGAHQPTSVHIALLYFPSTIQPLYAHLAQDLFKHNWALWCQPNNTAVSHIERRRPNPLCPRNTVNLYCWFTNKIPLKGV